MTSQPSEPARSEDGSSGLTMPVSGARRGLAMAVLLSSSPGQTLMFAALGPILPMLAERFGADGQGAFVAQMIMTMPALGVILGGLVSGWFIERWGIRPVLYTSLVAYAVFGAAGLYVNDSVALLGSRFLLGLAVAHHSPAVITLIAEWFGDKARAKLLGYQGAVSGVVSVGAGLAAGGLAEWGGWRAPFAIYLAGLVILVCAMIAIPAGRRRPAARANRGGSIWPLWPIYAVIVPLFMCVLMVSIQLSFLLADDGVTSPFIRAVIIAMGSVGSTMAGAIFGTVYGRMGPRRTRIVLASLMGVGFIIVGTSNALIPVALGCVMAGLGSGMSTPYMSGLLLSKSPPEIRGRAIGFMLTAIYVADLLNPWVMTPIRLAVGSHGTFIVVGGLLAATAIGMALHRPKILAA